MFQSLGFKGLGLGFSQRLSVSGFRVQRLWV